MSACNVLQNDHSDPMRMAQSTERLVIRRSFTPEFALLLFPVPSVPALILINAREKAFVAYLGQAQRFLQERH